jgi:hypothetical protein
MFESCILAAVSLGIVLYGQARILARDIRDSRARHPHNRLSVGILRDRADQN